MSAKVGRREFLASSAATATAGGGRGGMTAGGSLKIYAGMMRGPDEGLGRVPGARSRKKLDRSTPAVFTGDGGGGSLSFNWPSRGQKFQLFGGGTRARAIARRPVTIPAGRASDQVAVTTDWVATPVAHAGRNRRMLAKPAPPAADRRRRRRPRRSADLPTTVN